MLEVKLEIYRELQKHLDRMPIGYPKTESGVEIRILKHLFTPEEAYIATKLNLFPKKLNQIYRKLKNRYNSFEELEEKLKIMFQKGTIMIREVNNENFYLNVPLIIGMYEYQLGILKPEFVNNLFQYMDETFQDELNSYGIPQLRTIPIEEAIPINTPIADFDQIREIIKNTSNTIGIMDCICRVAHDLIGDPCKKTDLKKTCMTFGSSAWYWYERGEARFITKEEALDLVKEFEKIGLVPQPSNSQKPMVICNCCGCCCESLSRQRLLENPAQYFATNFFAEVDENECMGCGECEERCQMNAIIMKNEKSMVDLKRCIGCGVCVPKCPNGAIYLVHKERENIPPNDTNATYLAIMNKKAKLAQKNK